MRRAGFTPLEAAVALAILGMVATGALAAFAAESRAAARARASAPAAALARERLARLELLDAHALRTMPDSFAHGRDSLGVYAYEWTASARPVAREQDLYDLTVEVRWSDGRYALRTRSFRPAVIAAGGAFQ